MGGNGSKRVVCYVHAPSRVAAPEKAGGDAVGVEHTPGLYLSNTKGFSSAAMLREILG